MAAAQPSFAFGKLPPELLKQVLLQLDCQQLVDASRVCRGWLSIVQEILEDAKLVKGTNIKHTEMCDSDEQRADPSQYLDLRGLTTTAESVRRMIQQKNRPVYAVLPAGYSEQQLETVMESLPSLRRLTVTPAKRVRCPTVYPLEDQAGQHGEDLTDQWPLLLPDSLTELHVNGPGSSLEPLLFLQMSSARGCVCTRRFTNATLATLPTVSPRLKTLSICDCPGLTAAGLRLLSRLSQLKCLTLVGVRAGAVSDALLDALHSCSQLEELELGHPRRPPESDVPAAAARRLALACQSLKDLCIHTSVENSMAVLDALCLVGADLGRDFWLYLPAPVYSYLKGRPVYTWSARSGNGILIELWK